MGFSIAGFAIALAIHSLDPIRSLDPSLLRSLSPLPYRSVDLSGSFIIQSVGHSLYRFSIHQYVRLVGGAGWRRVAPRHNTQSSPHRFEGCRCPLLRRICAAPGLEGMSTALGIRWLAGLIAVCSVPHATNSGRVRRGIATIEEGLQGRRG